MITWLSLSLSFQSNILKYVIRNYHFKIAKGEMSIHSTTTSLLSRQKTRMHAINPLGVNFQIVNERT